MKPLLRQERFRLWLAIVGTATILLLTAYTLVQQSTRLAADDLPLATAQAAKQKLNKGVQAKDVVPSVTTNPRTDATTFVTVTDAAEHVLASSASLDGRPSLPPAGTFLFTKANGSDSFSWEPKTGVRIATYMLSYGKSPNDGFVIAGQSLKQAEDRISTYGWLALIGWLAILAWTSLILLFLPFGAKK